MAKTTHRKITLMMNEEEKTFFAKFSSARNVFKAQTLFKKLEDNEDEQGALMEVIDFLAKDVYKDQFTTDEFLDGVDSADFQDEIQTQLIGVMTRDVDGMKDFLKQEAQKKK